MIIAYHTKWSHMSTKSGFILIKYIREICGSENVVEIHSSGKNLNRGILKRVCNKFLKKEKNHYKVSSPWISAETDLDLKKIIRCAENNKKAIILLTGGETQLSKSIYMANEDVRKRTYVCFHQPPSWFKLNWSNYNELDGLGGIICVARNQELFFKDKTTSKIICIKHGVDLDFFRPSKDNKKREQNRILFVGKWLRDIETLEKTMKIIWKKNPCVVLDCVVTESNFENTSLLKLASDARVNIHLKISEHKLLELYQSLSILFCPLIDSTANNTILEGISSGIPIVTTEIGGVSEYLPKNISYTCNPGDPDDHARKIIEALNYTDYSFVEKISRDHIMNNNNWRSIAARLLNEIKYKK